MAITLSVATEESWKDDNDDGQSRTEWHRVVAFGKLAAGNVAGKNIVAGLIERQPRHEREFAESSAGEAGSTL